MDDDDQVNLPTSSAKSIINSVLPETMEFSQDAIDAITRSAAVFAMFQTTTAKMLSHKDKRKLIAPKHLLNSLTQTEFQYFNGPLERCLQSYELEQESKKKPRSSLSNNTPTVSSKSPASTSHQPINGRINEKKNNVAVNKNHSNTPNREKHADIERKKINGMYNNNYDAGRSNTSGSSKSTKHDNSLKGGEYSHSDEMSEEDEGTDSDGDSREAQDDNSMEVTEGDDETDEEMEQEGVEEEEEEEEGSESEGDESGDDDNEETVESSDDEGEEVSDEETDEQVSGEDVEIHHGRNSSSSSSRKKA